MDWHVNQSDYDSVVTIRKTKLQIVILPRTM
jgi:hypothetical protein